MMPPQPQRREAAARDENGHAPAAAPVPFTKLILVAVLAGLALCLQVTVWTLEVLVEERRSILSRNSSRRSSTLSTDEQSTAESSKDNPYTQQTIKSLTPTDAASLYLYRSRTTSPVTAAATAYRRSASQQWFATWDPNHNVHIQPIEPTEAPVQPWANDEEDTTTPPNTAKTTWHVAPLLPAEDARHTEAIWEALQTAAQQGDAVAQFHVANVYAAGFWPASTTSGSTSPTTTRPPLTVQEDWNVPTSHQQQLAWLYWRMAAQQGHVEATMALAHRMEWAMSREGTGQKPHKHNFPNRVTCTRTLSVWEAAAAGIMDQLEADEASRAKVVPASDQHELYLWHLHGGSATNPQLTGHNRPDESADALQFYHLRAVNMYGTDAAAQAAYTLGQYYHFGLRGVVQNVTKAAEYYHMAADQNHWEAAGQLGNFYLYGIGVTQDVPEARRLFQLGVPAGLEDCQMRFSQFAKNKKKDFKIALCESYCLNGLAIIHLVGIPDEVPIDGEKAEAFLELSKEQGNSEAMYNYAMLRLGWHRHWKSPEELPDDGQTSLAGTLLFSKKDAPPLNHPSQTEYTKALSDFRLAAAKGHLQSTFRAGLLYSQGIRIALPDGGYTHVISKDCEKATKYFKWIVEKASPDLARRMRVAYQQYLAGDAENALRNYLTAAATGSETAQLNAAFLLEKGTCPGLTNAMDCAKAAVRLYKAAAERGQGEACLRVGDFYYYGKLRSVRSPVGPLGWTRYLIFPEELWPLLAPWWEAWMRWLSMKEDADIERPSGAEDQPVCDMDDPNKPGTCAAHNVLHEEANVHDLEGDLSMAAHYYQLAVSSKGSARANFNLGFLYEWGLGLKQDFPLAKRHYDLAKASHSRESDLPVVIALFTMSLHERAIKLWAKFQQWRESGRISAVSDTDDGAATEDIPSPAISLEDGAPQPLRRTKTDVIMAHIFSWDSLLILVLTVLFVFLLDYMRTR